MASEITDYPSLSAAFENYLARTDLTEFLPYFVRVTEAWLNRQLRTREMMATAGLVILATHVCPCLARLLRGLLGFLLLTIVESR